jgi:pimeloyl-ACP methyl ester carboxylesterase
MKALGWIAGVTGVVVLAVVVALTSGALTLSLSELEARYKLPNSRFVEIDGVRVHYVDEGQGPALVLLHASFMSLHSWDDLAARLKSRYRVIRFDSMTNGLTGPDPNSDYSLQHNERILAALSDRLGVREFFLLGTSSGGTVAFRYAAAHPDQVRRLILVNSAGMPRTAATDPNRARGTRLQQWVRSYFKSTRYWRENLAQQFGGGGKPPDELVQRVYDMNRRDTLRSEGAAMMKQFQTGDPETVLGQITAPTLVMWGKGNITVAHLEGDVFQHWLFNAPTLLKKYEKVGHYFYLEQPEQFASDVDAFLTGQWDNTLLRVTRSTGLAPPVPAESARKD